MVGTELGKQEEGELFAVVACVAAVVSAFQDWTELFKKYKARRQAKKQAEKALQAEEEWIQDLELSLSRGERTVQDQYDRDYRRFGQCFAEGDGKLSCIDLLIMS